MAVTEGMMKIFERIKQRKQHYQIAVQQPGMQELLADLAGYCRANSTCVFTDENGKVDQRKTLILEGRREVWLYMQSYLNLSTQQLFALYTGKQFNPGEE